ncbi:MAG: restriction endonuclease subunit S [Dehalococcoidia bacterium]|nr:restriction endonuclease subunit S [Dehalococcoidia bacterium]
MPYHAYKDSGVPWLGQLPEHWDCAPVRRYCRVFAGATPSRAVPEYWANGTIPWLSSGDVNLRRITGANQFISQSGFAASSTKWIRPGSLVMALAGQGRTKGMVATVELDTTCNQSLAVVDPSPGKSDYRFLAYYLESRYHDIRGLVGDGLRDGLNLEHVRSIPTPLPTVSEQSAIVRFLDHADRGIRHFISAKRKLIGLLNEQKQAIIHRAVTRGLDSSVRLKLSGVDWLGDLPEHWEVRRLKFLLSGPLQYGANESSGSFDYSHPRYVRITDIDSDGTLKPDTFCTLSIETAEQFLLEVGDILFARSGATVGKTFCYENSWGKCAYAGYLIRAKVDPTKAVHRFVYDFTKSNLYSQWIASISIKATIQNVSAEKYASLMIPLPPLSEQFRIVSYIQNKSCEIDSAISHAKREIELMREYRTRLIADVVTGKVDVRDTTVEAIAEWGETDDLEIVDEVEDESPLEDDRVADD